MAQKIVAGNWKMNLTAVEAKELVKELESMEVPKDVDRIIFPSTLYVKPIQELNIPKLRVGVQNFSENEMGAFTGELAIEQLQSVKINLGLIGHSERRMILGETNEQLKNKVNTALKHSFKFIFCCGEPLDVREAGKEFDYVKQQLEESLFHLSSAQMRQRIIAYEPVWAIGTGKTATAEQAEEMHKAIRSWLTEKYNKVVAESVSILYGGSCKPSNAEELFSCSNVDGGLIGGASLKADDFMAIVNSFPK